LDNLAQESIMNHHHHTRCTTVALAFAGLALASLSSTAQAFPGDEWMEAVPMKSRPEVQSELAKARADGSIAALSPTYDFAARSPSVKSREQVQRELRSARASGELAAINAEAPTFEVPLARAYARK
jgi:hypothetical protein